MKHVSWLDVGEAGGIFGIRLMVVLCTLFGRAPGRLVLRILALYYTMFHRTARRGSRAWLERIHAPRRVRLMMVYSHILRFAQVTLDRMFLARGQLWRFRITLHGTGCLRSLRTANRGAILLGGHLGSFEALRCLAERDDVAVNVLGHFHNAKMINAILQKLDPQSRTRLLEIETGGINFIFEAKECIERGEHVAILADRIGLGGGTVTADFMGSPALFPNGAYVLAAALGCPVYLIFALYHEPNRYDVYCELFAEQVTLPRKVRSESIARYAQRYADRLAHYGRQAPDNWFHFYDFWSGPAR